MRARTAATAAAFVVLRTSGVIRRFRAGGRDITAVRVIDVRTGLRRGVGDAGEHRRKRRAGQPKHKENAKGAAKTAKSWHSGTLADCRKSQYTDHDSMANTSRGPAGD